ncbi:MAG: chaperonin GroEL [Planctomycetota bacterium]|nr:chaperonin GroEL [Planctomycetota bacterium]
MSKQILFDDNARQKMQAGIEKLAKTVRVTMGPAGRNVILSKSFGAPAVTKDGVSVAKEIDLEDPFENMGAKLVLEAAKKTNDVAGDGTTSATVLASAIYSEGLKHLATGVNPVALRNGIDKGVEAVVKHIAETARPVKNRAQKAAIAAISANNDQAIGDLLAEAFDRVGDEGVITIEENSARETVLEVVEGMQFDKGYVSPYFSTDPAKLIAELNDAYILICDQKISSARALVPILEKVMSTSRPLLIIAEDIDGEALSTLVINRLRGGLNVCAVKAPGFGDRRKAYLGDIACVTGGQAITEDLGLTLENVTVAQLGQAKHIRIDKDTTTIVSGAGAKKNVNSRCAQIRSQIDSTKSNYDKEKLEERLAKLTGGVAVIKVGGDTESEMKAKKDLVEDALNATRAAIQEGIVSGGGTCLLRAISVLKDVKVKGDLRHGIKILEVALAAPIRQIAENAGEDGSVIAEMVLEKKEGWGFDSLALEYVDFFKAGIIDPAKVVRAGLQNAASIAGLLLTTNSLVTELKDEDHAVAGSVN